MYIVAEDNSLDPTAVRQVTATVTVNVERNVAPVISDKNGYVKTISEGSSLDTEIFLIEATDANPGSSQNGQLVYSIEDNEALKKFQINNSGSITPRVSLKGIDIPKWNFNVRVSDKGIPILYDETGVTISLQKVGGPTFDSTEHKLTRSSNTPINTTLITLRANDQTPNGRLIYEIRGDGLASTYFRLEMDGMFAVLKIKKNFIDDTNKTPRYTIRVLAIREDEPLVYAEVLVYVTVVWNPNAPSFAHGNLVFDINETISINTEFGDCNATDIDTGSNGDIIYFFDDSKLTPKHLKSFFAINIENGKLYVTGDLKKEPSTFVYKMGVIAQDKGIPEKQDNIMVTVNVRRNPNPPKFNESSYEAWINENKPIGTSVITVAAVDEDGDPIIYAITETPPASLYFDIDPNSGEITTKALLFNYNVESYYITVYATDITSASQRADISVRVHIIRNSNAPVFAQGNWAKSISEYDPIGDLVVTVEATDEDDSRSSSSILRYRFGDVEPTAASQIFSISSTIGEITIAKSMIRTSPAPLIVTLQVLAHDSSFEPKTATATVIITIVRNQNTPLFISASVYNGEVYESDPAGTKLAQLEATDGDTEVPLNANTPNAEVMYSLKGGPNSYARFFEIGQDGWLINTQRLYVPTLQSDDITVSTITNVLFSLHREIQQWCISQKS